MICVYAKFTVKPDQIEAFVKKAVELVIRTKSEPGCVSYELCQDREQKHVFAMVEKWADDAALQTHLRSEGFNAMLPGIKALCSEEVQITPHEVIY
ncbi:MAG: antibiotic biosynthesis monooxygenase [Clostridiales bacterium]|nr:antibiotic biosynthesis monooxygenase [Clostridiales bacterium]